MGMEVSGLAGQLALTSRLTLDKAVRMAVVQGSRAMELPAGVAGAGGTRSYSRANICLDEAQSFFSPALCYSFVKLFLNVCLNPYQTATSGFIIAHFKRPSHGNSYVKIVS